MKSSRLDVAGNEGLHEPAGEMVGLEIGSLVGSFQPFDVRRQRMTCSARGWLPENVAAGYREVVWKICSAWCSLIAEERVAVELELQPHDAL